MIGHILFRRAYELHSQIPSIKPDWFHNLNLFWSLTSEEPHRREGRHRAGAKHWPISEKKYEKQMNTFLFGYWTEFWCKSTVNHSSQNSTTEAVCTFAKTILELVVLWTQISLLMICWASLNRWLLRWSPASNMDFWDHWNIFWGPLVQIRKDGFHATLGLCLSPDRFISSNQMWTGKHQWSISK